MWNSIVQIIDEAVGTFLVSCKLKNVTGQFEWAFSGVYGPNFDSELVTRSCR
jgi:hypothetical protein